MKTLLILLLIVSPIIFLRIISRPKILIGTQQDMNEGGFNNYISIYDTCKENLYIGSQARREKNGLYYAECMGW